MSALLMTQPIADKVISGELKGEIRRMKCTSKVGQTIYIAKCKTKTLIGTVKVQACIPVSPVEAKDHTWYSLPFICIPFDPAYTKTRYEWLFSDPVKFDKPIPYHHPRGAQIWVNINVDHTATPPA